jgi:hypothetical protein
MSQAVPICNREGGVGGHADPCGEAATVVVRCFDDHYLACRPCGQVLAAEEAPGTVSLHDFTFDPVAGTVTWTEPWTEFDQRLLEAYPKPDLTLGLNDAGQVAYTVAVRQTTVDGRPYWALSSPWEQG